MDTLRKCGLCKKKVVIGTLQKIVIWTRFGSKPFSQMAVPVLVKHFELLQYSLRMMLDQGLEYRSRLALFYFALVAIKALLAMGLLMFFLKG